MEGQNLPIKQNTDDDLILRDLYMLMAIFLESGPCQQAAQTLISECEKNKLFPDLFDWSGDPQIIEGDVGRGGPDRWTILVRNSRKVHSSILSSIFVEGKMA